MSSWNKIIKPIVVLSVMCVVVTGALALTNGVTAPVIKAATAAAQEKARTELLPDATGFTQVEGEYEGVSAIYTADNGVGTVITCAAKGYGGSITVMVAFADGTIKQIKVTEQAETQGLGSKIVSEAGFRDSFAGLPAQPFTVSDIDTITGATISSKAVTTAVNYAVAAYAAIS